MLEAFCNIFVAVGRNQTIWYKYRTFATWCKLFYSQLQINLKLLAIKQPFLLMVVEIRFYCILFKMDMHKHFIWNKMGQGKWQAINSGAVCHKSGNVWARFQESVCQEYAVPKDNHLFYIFNTCPFTLTIIMLSGWQHCIMLYVAIYWKDL